MTDPMTTGERPAPILFNPQGLYDPGPNGYSHLALLPAGAPLVLVSGQGGETADGSLPTEFRAQVRQAFANLLTALQAAGSAPEAVAKLTVLIVEHNEAHLGIFGEELAHAFESEVKPACTLIPVPRLALDGMLFEVEAIAMRAE